MNSCSTIFDYLLSNAIAIGAFIVSITALIFTIYHSIKTREHFKLSVRPHLSYEFGAIPDRPGYFHITVFNRGTGPAIVTRFRVIIGQQEISIDSPGAFTEVVRKNTKLPVLDLQTSVPHSQEAISQNSSITFIKFRVPNDFEMLVGNKKSLIEQLGFNFFIEFEFLYKEKFPRAEFPPSMD